MNATRLCLLVSATMLSACAPGVRTLAAPAPVYEWATASPEDVGLERAPLQRMTDAIRSGVEYRDIHALLIVKDGRLVYEEYFAGEDEHGRRGRLGHVVFDRDTRHDLRSVTKSVVSALVGIAVGSGAIASIDQPLLDFFPEHADLATPELRALTLRHVLTMSAGFDWQEWGTTSYDDSANVASHMNRTADVVRFVLERPIVAPPGTRWTYNGGLTHLLAEVVVRTTGRPLVEFARETLFEPLGITDVEWYNDAGRSTPDADSGLRLRPRDMAKFGLLYAQRGRWGDRQVVPAAWVDESLRRHVATADSLYEFGADGGVEVGYGLHWFHAHYRLPHGSVIAHRAVGNGGQRVFIDPGHRLVVVVTAGRYDDADDSDRLILERVLPWASGRRDADRLGELRAVQLVAAGEWPEVVLTGAERARYVGTYRQDDSFVRVWDDGTALRIESFPGLEGGVVHLVPLGNHVFATGRYDGGQLTRIYWPDGRIEFRVDADRATGYIDRSEDGRVYDTAERVQSAEPPGELLLSASPPVWFEGFGAPVLVRPDGRMAITTGFAGPGDVRAVSLPGGEQATDLATGGVADVQGAVFGPGGQIIVYGTVADEGGWFALDATGPRRLLLPSGGVPRWSPDGRGVAVSRSLAQGGGLTVLQGESERSIMLADEVVGLGWMPDGRYILVLTTDSVGVSALHRADAVTGSIQTLVRGLDATSSFEPLAVSPDGLRAYLALASAAVAEPDDRHRPVADRDLDIYEVDLHTGARRVVVATPGDDFAPAVVDGHLYWTSSAVEHAVVVVPAGGGPARVVVEDAQLPTWRPDGRAIGYTFGDWRRADWVLGWEGGLIEVDTGAVPVAPPRPYITGYHEDFPPVWSPDGRWVAYHSHRSAGPSVRYAGPGITDDIYLRREGSTEEIRLTDFGLELGSPSWSPDGSRLVYTGAAVDFHHDAAWITTIDPHSGRALDHRRLEVPDSVGEVTDAVWSPVGEVIAVAAPINAARRALWLVRPDGAVIRRVADYAIATFGGLDWTPDGRRIVFPGISNGRMQIFVVSADGGVPRQLTRDDANLLHPKVSPDGRWIAATRIKHRRELRRMPLPR